MSQPEPSIVRPWSARLSAFLRAGSAMAGASLALIMALNLELAPIGSIPSPASSDAEVVAGTSAGRDAGLRHWEGRAPAAGGGLVHDDLATIVWVPTPSEQLPPGITALTASAPEDGDAATPPDPGEERIEGGPAIVLNLVPVDAAAISGSDPSDGSEESDDDPVAPAAPPAGGPS